MGSITDLITTLGKNARTAAKTLRGATTQAKNNALINIANQIDSNRVAILAANAQDLSHGKDNGLD
ncbi:MAG TPA: gamma-glutamyl-phosphate reductase, partial [Gammaproteobacteria bacterium]|nr:gamma-glutamyl-phosphate reductase [Gammaproteobacteria bacterium]